MRGLLNIDKGYFPAPNLYGFPELEPCRELVPDFIEWFSFPDRNLISSFAGSGVHFYCHDFTFESLWTTPKKYVDFLRSVRFVVMPDFSMYYNFPVALQIYNKYRNHWLARYLGHYGANVIPNVSVSDLSCFEWSFLGYPVGSVVAFSDIGSSRSVYDKVVIQRAYEEMLVRLRPRQVLYFTSSVSRVPAGAVPVIVGGRYGKR